MQRDETSRYQVFFRTKKGGCGIEYEAAKAEFLRVFGENRVELTREVPSRMRMHLAIRGLSIEEVCHRAERLGYTQGIVSVHEEPYRGEELHSQRTGRWAVGWLRRDDKKLLLTEIYRQDEEKLLDAPHNRTFLIEVDGEVRTAKGHRYRRGLSPLDAMFILNIAQLRGDELMLDPFAGIGGIVMECRRRNLSIFAADVDSALRPGLARIARNQCVIADARRLPFKDSTFHAIITEPPFDTRYRQAVLDSMSELRRIVRDRGKIVLLIAHDMHRQIMDSMAGSRFRLKDDFTLRRHDKLISHVLVMSDQ